MEASFAPSLNTSAPDSPLAAVSGLSGLIPSVSINRRDGRFVTWSNNVRIAIPTTTTRLEPFFVAGGGVANTKREVEYSYTIPPILIPQVPAGIVTIPSRGQGLIIPVSSSQTSLALTIGGGVGIKATSHLWIDADLRLIHVLDNDDQNVGRFGVAARYRF